MVSRIEIDDYEDYGENIYGRKSNHGKKLGKKNSNSEIHQEILRIPLLSQISNNLSRFPRKNEQHEDSNSTVSYAKNPYINWLKLSLADGYPAVNPVSDFRHNRIFSKKHTYSLVHELSGIRIAYIDDESYSIAVLHTAESKLLERLDKHLHLWQQLSKIDGQSFNPERILEQILPPLVVAKQSTESIKNGNSINN